MPSQVDVYNRQNCHKTLTKNTTQREKKGNNVIALGLTW